MRNEAKVRDAALGSALFFLVAPGVVAGVVPWLLTRWRDGGASAATMPARVVGALLAGAGAAVLVGAFVRFVREGRGTPAPVAPTEHLVVGGLYRHVRNPMYVAVVALVVGQGLLLARPVLLVYACVVAAAMAVFARWHEEPALERRFGAEYQAYRRAVRPWRPQLRGWPPRPGDDRSARGT